MHESATQARWYDWPWAALLFFTRLPLWRLHQPPRQCYSAVVEFWPLTGWVTGLTMGGALLGGSMLMPWPLAVVLAVVVRLLLTGALHEDGLADFVDGFGGGGHDRQRILDIMKDSRIGTYGVLALVCYLLLLVAALASMQPLTAACLVVAADPFAKMVASTLVVMLPYARNEQQAKSHVVYRRMSVVSTILLAVQGLVPLIAFCLLSSARFELLYILPSLVMYLLYRLMWSRLRGYTGDCCGAVCVLAELTVYLVASSQHIVMTFQL